MRILRTPRLPLRGLRLRPPAGLGVLVRDAAGRPGPAFLVAATAVVVATALVAIAVSVTAERSYGERERTRAAAEALSVAEHSALLATGDAFSGYIQLLRDADDREVRAIGTPSDVRTAALRRLLELNTNRFSGLAVIGLDGRVVAATDGTMLDATVSPAFAAVRANQGNANSDIVLDPPGQPGHVDYASILIDDTGEKWGVLVARARADRLWQTTLSGTVDGGQNIIINREGQLAAGVPAGLLGQPWRGRGFTGGAIRAQVGGVDSVCGLGAIAPDTQIDHQWNVASCLPASTVLIGAGAGSRVWLTAIAAFIVAAVAGSALLRVFSRPAGAPIDMKVEADALEPEPESEPEVEPPAPEPAEPPPNIDARTLISAYEERNARLAARVRESVQARLLVASSRVEEAVELHEESPDLARVMLERAASELDDLNERELRALGQELYPDLVRLGLPAALRALRKDVADLIEVEVAAAADADSVDDTSQRAIGTPRRILMYRLVLDAVRQFAEAGLESCTVTLSRGPSDLWLSVKGHGETEAPDEDSFAASALAAEAYGGKLTLDHAVDAVQVTIEFDEAAGGAESDQAAGGGAQDEPQPDTEDHLEIISTEPEEEGAGEAA